MVKFLNKLGRDESGATAVEYGLIVALIFIAMLGAVTSFSNANIATYTAIETAVTSVTGA
ncbi:Flp family type IVb pilin [Qipengyuania sp. XHP0207]|uniref:Flp family type IVb pilin n=1 Tax=Qipengyuania sp. XHP0207 TaxID=3038078 RepID=UPI00241D93F4|nr:Flp family type IVb pilin [Qipengyuania sp. XHP0207]MDG5748583.1 Flp family type IVb pilin [Qipengyuania sp. XHP0207]